MFTLKLTQYHNPAINLMQRTSDVYIFCIYYGFVEKVNWGDSVVLTLPTAIYPA